MQRLIIDCTKKQELWQDFTAEEEVTRLAEMQQALIDEAAKNKKMNKAQLIRVLAELREMKQNRDVFTDIDIDEKQVEIDILKMKVQA